jgi:hypothetical protein
MKKVSGAMSAVRIVCVLAIGVSLAMAQQPRSGKHHLHPKEGTKADHFQPLFTKSLLFPDDLGVSICEHRDGKSLILRILNENNQKITN